MVPCVFPLIGQLFESFTQRYQSRKYGFCTFLFMPGRGKEILNVPYNTLCGENIARNSTVDQRRFLDLKKKLNPTLKNSTERMHLNVCDQTERWTHHSYWKSRLTERFSLEQNRNDGWIQSVAFSLFHFAGNDVTRSSAACGGNLGICEPRSIYRNELSQHKTGKLNPQTVIRRQCVLGVKHKGRTTKIKLFIFFFFSDDLNVFWLLENREFCYYLQLLSPSDFPKGDFSDEVFAIIYEEGFNKSVGLFSFLFERY